jgi:flagellar biogenesis protein FliO
LLALVLLLAFLSRPAPRTQSAGFRLPADEAYATQDAPLFSQSHAQNTPTPIGVSEPPGLGIDFLDLTLKLVAVLALAYGSLALLKRTGFGGAGSVHGGGLAAGGLRVLSTLALAPNRSVHVVRVPGGKTLLLGATPGQVNLIADLGEVPEAELAAAESGMPSFFFDVLASKLTSAASQLHERRAEDHAQRG